MRILITNDDGINAPGLTVMEAIAREIAGPDGEVWTVAPAFEQSGVAHKISYTHPMMLARMDDRRYAAEGSPADCVLAGLYQVMKDTPPDLVLSLLAATCMTLVTFAGFRAINILATLMVPVLAAVTAILFYNALSGRSLPARLAAEIPVTLTRGEGISAIVGAIIVGAIILPDITRFVRGWRGAIGVTLVSHSEIGSPFVDTVSLGRISII